MSYALRQQHGLPGELKREHALFSGIGPPSSSLQSTPLSKAEPRSTIATNTGAGGRATATKAAVSSMCDAPTAPLLDASNRSPARRLVNTNSVPPVDHLTAGPIHVFPISSSTRQFSTSGRVASNSWRCTPSHTPCITDGSLSQHHDVHDHEDG
ncbi:hypothetical protein SAMN04487926_13417 [Paraburkholderia steynii]|uniref:Uncharacterized protein n=1 Tax=Paraburkholderia steynii TaxID=1245441 RepID=A0A7Z7FLK0_9BURK|nr:hypothetical protein SAMN04487926_13417 [Paraburkholderia steynii]